LNNKNYKIKEFFTLDNNKANYIYDFGDYWQHKVQLEKIIPAEKGIVYPVCIAGKRACPPEDCGGTFGYEEIVKGVSEYQEEYSDYAFLQNSSILFRVFFIKRL